MPRDGLGGRCHDEKALDAADDDRLDYTVRIATARRQIGVVYRAPGGCGGGADERGHAVARGKTQPVRALLGGIVRAWEKRSGGPIERIIISWPEVVGDAIAANTRPFELDEKLLIVEVRDTIWRDELARFYKGQILRKLNKQLGGAFVRDLRFRVATDPSTWETH